MQEDVAPRRHRAQRSPTPTKKKRSPRSPPHHESKKEKKDSKKKKERKRSPSSPSSSPSSSSDGSGGYFSKNHQGEDIEDHMLLGEGKNGTDDNNLRDKNRRLTVEQINYLEMSFTEDLKLEPERKAFIAKQLGLRPRQVAIWFQNRRARWKNKQVEQDYEMLKANYDAAVKEKETLIKDYESAVEDNKRLQAEVARLTNLLHVKDTNNMLLLVEEQPNGNLECRSPTKSTDCQSEIDDIFVSSDAKKVVTDNTFLQELNTSIACALRAETDCSFFSSSDNVFSSLPLLVQKLIANGHCFEDAYSIYLGCEYFAGGWR
ncbi:hypothetical protein L7F22_000506 [Adiantum nelumboides]|nr:hypothetical protein [Adiantum nelumboides]